MGLLLVAIRDSTVLVTIFWNFSMFYERSESPQVKENLISSITNLIYELPHEFSNDLKLTILGN